MALSMTVALSPTRDGLFAFQLYLSRRKPKLAANGSHYLLADHSKSATVELGGKTREVRALVKIWAPIPPAEREAELRRFSTRKVRSPILR